MEKKAENTAQRLPLYSTTLPDDIRQTVQQIPAPAGVDAFYSYTEIENGDHQTIWWQARENQSGTWNVRRYTRISGTDTDLDDINTPETVLCNVCYFDALRFVNESEISAKARGCLTSEEPPHKAGIHVSAAAKKSYQPQNPDGYIVPAVGGDTLVDEPLHDQEQALAARSGNMKLTPVETGALALNTVFDSTALVPAGSQDFKTTIDQQGDLLAEKLCVKRVVDNIQKVSSTLSDLKDRQFKFRFDFDDSSARDQSEYRLHVHFSPCDIKRGYKICRAAKVSSNLGTFSRRLKEAASKAKSPDIKSLVQEFMAVADATYSFEKAACIFEEYNIIAGYRGNYKKAMRDVFKLIDKGAKKISMEPAQVEALKQSYVDTKQPARGSYCEALERHSRNVIGKLNKYTRAI